jgi:hypothetical protein
MHGSIFARVASLMRERKQAASSGANDMMAFLRKAATGNYFYNF